MIKLKSVKCAYDCCNDYHNFNSNREQELDWLEPEVGMSNDTANAKDLTEQYY